jgi:hypothetical protein
VACGRVLKATVAERVSVRSIPPALLAGYQHGDAGLVVRVVADPSFRRRNRLALDDDGTWELDCEPVPPDRVRVRVEVELAEALSVRPVQVVAAGLSVSRSYVERMLASGVIRSATRLDGQTAAGFGFTIDQRRC